MQYTLRYLHELVGELEKPKEINVVHWNNVLWDCLRLFGDEQMYKALLVRVYNRIHMFFPNAKIIFALTTPITEEMTDKNFTRKNTEIEEYNKAAINVLKPLGVKINDLYTIGKELRSNYFLDGVHYNEEGSSILADKVIEAIEEAF